MIICKLCGKVKEHEAHGLCQSCYLKGYKKPMITCKICGKTNNHYTQGLCRSCYQKQWKKIRRLGELPYNLTSVKSISRQ